MVEYESGYIRKMAAALEKCGVSEDIASQILEGGEKILKKTSGEKRAEWMKEAMRRMDSLLDADTRRAVREDCACCLGGQRHEVSKGIFKKHATIEERIAAANEARFVFGHSVVRQADGSIIVSFFPDGRESYGCVCLRKAKEPISITYCYCCGGHVKHHLQTALGMKLSCKVLSSALSSGGKKPCKFEFTAPELAKPGASSGQ